MTSYRFRWDAVWNSLDFLMSGLQMTLVLSAATLLLAMIGGLLIAGLDMSRWRVLRWIGISFGEVIRNTPILVQLLWVYYVLPIVFGVGIGAATVWLPYAKIAHVLKWLALFLFAYILTAIVVRPNWIMILRDTVIPTLPRGKASPLKG